MTNRKTTKSTKGTVAEPRLLESHRPRCGRNARQYLPRRSDRASEADGCHEGHAARSSRLECLPAPDGYRVQGRSCRGRVDLTIRITRRRRARMVLPNRSLSFWTRTRAIRSVAAGGIGNDDPDLLARIAVSVLLSAEKRSSMPLVPFPDVVFETAIYMVRRLPAAVWCQRSLPGRQWRPDWSVITIRSVTARLPSESLACRE